MKKGVDHFRIATTAPSETIVVSPKFLGELKKLPDNVLSMTEAIAEVMQASYVKLDVHNTVLPHTVRASLTPALVRLNPIIADEAQEAMNLELPQSGDWTEVHIFGKLLRIVAMASGRIFVGPELCRDERYLEVSTLYTVDLVEAARIVTEIPSWRRPLFAPIHPAVRKVHRRLDEAIAFLRPVVAARQEAARRGEEKPDDMLQWIIDDHVAGGQEDAAELARMQLGVSFAAIHTTTMTTTSALYTLAAMPELVPVLRQDVQQALDASGGEFTNISMQNMKKLDSFLKECMRFYPFSSGSFTRKVLQPVTLSNGQHIPAGVFLEVPAGGISRDNDVFPDADTFDALRFYDMRQAKDADGGSGTQAAGVVANSQFVGVGSTSLTFGYGRHACPGRFFAANEIKMIMAEILLRYEIVNPPGVEGRYKDMVNGASHTPDPTKHIMMRKVA
jgi:cytochrome P450